ncbi:MAG: alpha-ketoglutarate-dependent dioxygenase AlkB [Sphingomonas sp.]
MPDLFDTPLLPGLSYAEDAVARDEERVLIAAIDAAGLAPFRFQGWAGKRVTHGFGWRYDFDDASFAPAAPIPDWLAPLRVRAADFAGLRTDDLVHALLIRYDPGAGIGWQPRSAAFRACDRGLARRAGDDAVPPAPRRRVRPCRGAARPALDLSPRGRGAARVGAQHRADGGAALVDHLPKPIGQGPAARRPVTPK